MTQQTLVGTWMALFGVRCQPSRRGQPLGLIPTGCAHAVPEQLPCERSEALLDLRRGPSASDRAIAQDVAMEEFIVELRFRFRAESLGAAGVHLHRLSEAARAAGFDMETGKVLPAPPREADSGGGWKGYAPLVPEPEAAVYEQEHHWDITSAGN